MPFRDPLLSFRDILEGIRLVEEFTSGMDLKSFGEDARTVAAVERNLQKISEAAVRLGDDAEKLCPGPPWRNIRGIGNWLLREAPEEGQMKDVDIVIGDPSMTEVLREAGAHRAEAVLAMLADDSDNAFVVLAVKELDGTAKTVAAVNDARHLGRVKLAQPDVVIAPQVLGGELTAMLLSGEQVTPDFVMQRVFLQPTNDSPASPTAVPDKKS